MTSWNRLLLMVSGLRIEVGDASDQSANIAASWLSSILIG